MPDGHGALVGAGAGTTLGDGTAGAGQEATVGAGMLDGAGATHIMAGAGQVTAGAATMAATGTTRITEGTTAEIMPICPEEEDIVHAFPALPYHLELMPMPVDTEAIVAVPMQRFPETAIWPIEALVDIAIVPM